MIDDFAKDHLHGRLRRDREALVWKLDACPSTTPAGR